MKEYRISKGWDIFMYLGGAAMILLSGWVMILPLLNGHFYPNLSWILIPVGGAMVALMVMAILETYYCKIIVDDEKITAVGVFSTKMLRFGEIKGYVLREPYLVFESRDAAEKKIKINFKYMAGGQELFAWAESRFTNLGAIREQQQQQAVQADECFGATPEIREKNLREAQRNARILNIAGFFVMLWVVFRPQPYEYAAIAAAILPPLAIFLAKTSSGRIRLHERKKYPNVAAAVICPGIGLAGRVILDFNIYSYANLWPLLGISTVILTGVTFIGKKEFGMRKTGDVLAVLVMAIFLAAYSFGTIVFVNCYYDDSQAEVRHTTVLEKHFSTQKRSISYYIKLSPREDLKDVGQIIVHPDLYSRLELGDEVAVFLKRGKLGIPWFFVTDGR